MADMIDINIGGDSVKVPKWALEETQRKILKTAEQSETVSSKSLDVLKILAKQSGVSTKQLSLLQSKYTKTVKIEQDQLRESKKTTQEQKAFKEKFRDFSNVTKTQSKKQIELSKIMNTRLKSIKEVANVNTDSLAGFVSDVGDVISGLPFIGATLGAGAAAFGVMIGVLEKFGDSITALTSVGIGLHGNIMEMKTAASVAGLDLDSFGEIIVNNTKVARAFGDTMHAGAKGFANVSAEFIATTAALGNFGMTNTEMNEFLAEELELMRQRGALEGKTSKELAESAKQLLLSNTALADLNGGDRNARLRARHEALSQVSVMSYLSTQTGDVSQKLGELAASLNETDFGNLGPEVTRMILSTLAGGGDAANMALQNQELYAMMGEPLHELFNWVQANIDSGMSINEFQNELNTRTRDMISNTRMSDEQMRLHIMSGNQQYGEAMEMILESQNLLRGINNTSSDAVQRIFDIAATTETTGSMKIAGISSALEREANKINESLLSSSMNLLNVDIENAGAGLVDAITTIGDSLNFIIEKGLDPAIDTIQDFMGIEDEQEGFFVDATRKFNSWSGLSSIAPNMFPGVKEEYKSTAPSYTVDNWNDDLGIPTGNPSPSTHIEKPRTVIQTPSVISPLSTTQQNDNLLARQIAELTRQVEAGNKMAERQLAELKKARQIASETSEKMD